MGLGKALTVKYGKGDASEAAVLRMADETDMLRRGKHKETPHRESLDKICAYFLRKFPAGSREERFLADFLSVVREPPKDFCET